YDSVYNHAVLNGHGRAPGNDSLSFGNTPLLAYNATTKTYSPRREFFSFGQLFKWVPIGAQRIGAGSNSTSIKIEAFQDPATSRLTLVGQNTSSSAQTLTLSLAHVPAPTSLQYFQTNAGSNMAPGPAVVVSGGAATVTVPGNTTFTLTGTSRTRPTPRTTRKRCCPTPPARSSSRRRILRTRLSTCAAESVPAVSRS